MFFGCLIIKLMLEVYDRKLMENRDKKNIDIKDYDKHQ